MKILLIGRDGQVGWELQRSLAPIGDVIALSRATEGRLCGDLEKPDALRQTIASVAPDVIVNAAAYTAVDRAESEPERAERVNAAGPAVLAEESARFGALLVHFSTDYVFDGGGDRPWREDDSAAPLNVYGASKWRGEEAVRAGNRRHLIFRTEWVYSARRGNFLRTMLRLTAEKDSLDVIDDQFGAPTGAELIADVTAHAVAAACSRHGLTGTFHLAAGGETTWHQYARFIAAEAGRAGWPVRASEDAIRAVSSDALPMAARRPRNSRLCTARLRREFTINLPAWQDGVRRTLAEITAQHGDGRAA